MRITLNATERETYKRYAALHLPRHTSYPAVPFWRGDYAPAQAEAALRRSNAGGKPLSLYFHIPYCEQLCYYCACNKVIQPKRDPGRTAAMSADFLDHLMDELARKAALLDLDRPVEQVHLGGGSPTYLPSAELRRIFRTVRERFRLSPDAELAVEVDPRITSEEQLAAMREAGVNRLSLGIQDFDAGVQEAVNRTQPFDSVRDFMATCRGLGYGAINFDLIYGLPFQTPESIRETLRLTIQLAPDRIAFYRLAVIPEIFKWQRTFKREDLPRGDVTLRMFLDAREALEGAGYEFIGLDHFAKKSEGLAEALRKGTLRRTFQGMTTGAGLDLVGMGPSGISMLDDAYFQNAKVLDAWAERLTRGACPVECGMDLTAEDRLRRDLLQDLYCYAEVKGERLKVSHNVDYATHFAAEHARIADLEADGLVVRGADGFTLTPVLGRLLMRVPAAAFDAYLPPNAYKIGLPPAESSAVG